jgi:hypothetical protein
MPQAKAGFRARELRLREQRFAFRAYAWRSQSFGLAWRATHGSANTVT